MTSHSFLLTFHSRLAELNEKAHALQIQNDYLATRIDGNEEDKGALRYELRRGEDELRQAREREWVGAADGMLREWPFT